VITVRDALLLTFEVPFIITQPSSAPVGSVISQMDVQCNGGNTGSVVVTGSGGTPPYMYKLESGIYQGSGSFIDLYSGSFTITIQDADLCTSDFVADITEPDVLTIAYTSEDASCLDVADGIVDLSIGGGSQPFGVLWPDGNTSGRRQDLFTGTYRIIITDSNGCTASQDVDVGLSEMSKCLSVQEIITPNNDGFYDTWKIKNIEMFPNAEVHVFNRWGEKVFSTKNLPDNEWDGTFNGKLLPTDSYHYVLYLNNGSDPITGIVTIIR
jgi:gliding motility-associated-like protein